MFYYYRGVASTSTTFAKIVLPGGVMVLLSNANKSMVTDPVE